MAKDPDGWLRSFTVDWGDGSAPEVVTRGETTCQNSPAGWPQLSMLVMFTGAAVHHDAAPGAYTVTATARSNGMRRVHAPAGVWRDHLAGVGRAQGRDIRLTLYVGGGAGRRSPR
jgi:hypothetical protein